MTVTPAAATDPPMVRGLPPHHHDLLVPSAIPLDVASALGYSSITHRQMLLDLGLTPTEFHIPGIFIPLRTPSGTGDPRLLPRPCNWRQEPHT
mgnify:CR=1 FL=1